MQLIFIIILLILIGLLIIIYTIDIKDRLYRYSKKVNELYDEILKLIKRRYLITQKYFQEELIKENIINPDNLTDFDDIIINYEKLNELIIILNFPLEGKEKIKDNQELITNFVREYNNYLLRYDGLVLSFPAKIIAKIFKYPKKKYFRTK